MDTKKQLLTLIETASNVAVLKERARILEEIDRVGPTGDYFEIHYDALVEIIAPEVSQNGGVTSTNK